MLKKPLFWETIIFFVIVGSLHSIASIYHLYWSVYEFDSIVHFFAGAALSLFFLWLYFFSGYFDPSRRNLAKFLVVSFLGVMFGAMLWESYELVFGQTMVQKVDYSYDTIMDILMTFLGALVACFYGYLKEHNAKS